MAKIERQFQLPTRTAARIAYQSLVVRFTRTFLTFLTIVMAIAFLTSIWARFVLEPAVRHTFLSAQGAGGQAVVSSGSRAIWLIGLSLLVCAVGITNAMLMSVMDRYREIGTMKCLGALDSFILKMFLLEALFLGAAGALAGVLLGVLATLVTLWWKFGSATGQVSWSGLWLIAGASFAIGVLITTCAALYPATTAARMQPIAAMRVDV